MTVVRWNDVILTYYYIIIYDIMPNSGPLTSQSKKDIRLKERKYSIIIWNFTNK